MFFFFFSYVAHRDLHVLPHSFPTRLSSDLYIRTLLDGIAPIPEIDPGIRAEVRALSVAEAYLALQQEDSESAARLAPADSSRIARALEVIRSTRKPLGWWHAHMEGGIGGEIALRPLLLLPPKPWLFERCDRRFDHLRSEQPT